MECQLDNITVYYDIKGAGKPLLMLHGMPLDHRHMIREMEPLFERRAGWQRVYVDLPGMGQTPGSDTITCQDDMLNVIMAFIDRVIPGQRFAVAGLSYGGYMARGLVYCRGTQIDGVLLTVPAVLGDRDQWDLPAHLTVKRDEALLAELDDHERQGIEGMAVVQSRRVVECWRSGISPAVDAADHTFIERLNQRRAFSFDPDALPAPFEKPALIVTGRQDHVCGYRDAWNLLERYPRATFAVLDRAGHCLTMEQEDLFHALVSEWLDRVEEAAAVS